MQHVIYCKKLTFVISLSECLWLITSRTGTVPVNICCGCGRRFFITKGIQRVTKFYMKNIEHKRNIYIYIFRFIKMAQKGFLCNVSRGFMKLKSLFERKKSPTVWITRQVFFLPQSLRKYK